MMGHLVSAGKYFFVGFEFSTRLHYICLWFLFFNNYKFMFIFCDLTLKLSYDCMPFTFIHNNLACTFRRVDRYGTRTKFSKGSKVSFWHWGSIILLMSWTSNFVHTRVTIYDINYEKQLITKLSNEKLKLLSDCV